MKHIKRISTAIKCVSVNGKHLIDYSTDADKRYCRFMAHAKNIHYFKHQIHYCILFGKKHIITSKCEFEKVKNAGYKIETQNSIFY